MLWLFHNAGPYLEVAAKWEATTAQRKLLQDSISIHEYVNKFPCLKQQHGWEMVSLDYFYYWFLSLSWLKLTAY